MCGRVEIPADLPEGERQRRAEYAKRGHMAQLAYRSAISRSTNKRTPASGKASVQEVDRVSDHTTAEAA